MAIAYVGSADLGNNGGTTNNLTTVYVVTAGSTLLRICFFGDLTNGADDITAVTYSGVAATLERKGILGNSGLGNRFVYNYALYNPPSGSHSVSITSTANHYLLGGVAEYSGVLAFDASAEQFTGSANPSVTASVTTIADNCWVSGFLEIYDGVNAPVAGAGMTMRVTDAAFGSWGIGDSNGPKHPAGSYSMTGALAGGGNSNRDMILDVVSFSPAVGIPASAMNLSVMP